MAGLDGCGKLDITEMSPDNVVAIGNLVWVKAEVEEKIWIWCERPCTVIKFDEACYARKCDDKDEIPKAILNAADNLNMLGACEARDADNQKNPENKPNIPSQSSCENLGQGKQHKAKTIKDDVVAGDNKEKLQKASSAVGVRDINHIGFAPSAVIPSAAAIPMRSNTVTYGPYASSNFNQQSPGVNGGTQVEVNTDLAPWVFGSTAGMNAAGQNIVESMAIGLVKAETGSITVPGLPLSQFSYLGSTLGSGGATLSSLSFSFGSNGISTTYDFRTYTPKFGGLSRHLIDRIKDISKNRTEQLRFLRNQQTIINKTGRKIQQFNKRFPPKDNRNAGANNERTLGRVLVAEMYDWQAGGQRTVIGVDKLHNSIGEMVYDYDKKAYMSWDLFFGPMSKYGDGGLPRFAGYNIILDHHSSPQQAQPPFAIDTDLQSEDDDPFVSGLNEYNLKITTEFVDPLTNNFNENEHHHDGAGRGHVIDLVGAGDEVPTSGLITNFYRIDDANRYDDDYRFLGMRGPIVLQSWGYDTNGKPIPNEADNEDSTKDGFFKDTDLKDAFLKDWLAKPATWPVAPIDLRFDRNRGVWVSPPAYKVVVAVLDEKLDSRSFPATASLINFDNRQGVLGPAVYDHNGNKVSAEDNKGDNEAKIQVIDYIGQTYPKGTRIYAYYDTFTGYYIVLDAAPQLSIRFRVIDLCENTPVMPDYGNDWTKYAGYGDKFPNNHILGIRINCNGDPINYKGDLIDHEDILDEEKRKDILINLFDTCGIFGPSYAYYDVNGGQESFNKWKEDAATGFALLCSPPSSYGDSEECWLGEITEQCSTIQQDYNSYDIVFMDSYARFIECTLDQKLYMTANEAVDQFPNDDFKKLYPAANAAATINEFYGNPVNGKIPKFYKNDNGGLVSVDFRVFDPYENTPNYKNPFYNLEAGDKVLVIFDEKNKRYVIHSAVKDDEKLVRFALVDNKDIGDRYPRAVLIDIEGYPIDLEGTRLNQATFNANNFITLIDPYAVYGYVQPEPLFPNYGANTFGPALGSSIFQEHMHGIPLSGGDEIIGSPWFSGPFTGYAYRKRMDRTATVKELKNFKYQYQIVWLEHFAKYAAGKIASTKPVVNGNYFLGVRANGNNNLVSGWTEGRLPLTRDPIPNDPKNRANLAIQYYGDFNAGGDYIAGDYFEGDKYVAGHAFECTDGCYFNAVLDPLLSNVNGKGPELLVYTIIDTQNIARRGYTLITNREKIDLLNKDSVKESIDPIYGIKSDYYEGWMWSKENSPDKYEQTTILNRIDWKGKAKLIQHVPAIVDGKEIDTRPIHTDLVYYNPGNGAVSYVVSTGPMVADVFEGNVPANNAGLFGKTNMENNNARKVSFFGDRTIYQGESPVIEILSSDDQPLVNPGGTTWMTYEGSHIVALWNEQKSHEITNAEYRMVYVREAPITMTGTCQETFEPFESGKAIKIAASGVDGVIYSTCHGWNKDPVKGLLLSAKNPMGYGASQGDLVTVQRVVDTSGKPEFAPQSANYYYIVIGTGKPPEKIPNE